MGQHFGNFFSFKRATFHDFASTICSGLHPGLTLSGLGGGAKSARTSFNLRERPCYLGNLSHKLWLSKGLLKSIRSKTKLCKQFLRNPSVANEAHYKNDKNKLNHSLRIDKISFYGKKLNEVKSNTRAIWRLLYEILNRKTSKVKSVSTFKIDGKDISDPLTIANKFSEYFSNIGPSLAKGITTTSSHRAFLSGTFVQSVFLAPAT